MYHQPNKKIQRDRTGPDKPKRSKRAAESMTWSWSRSSADIVSGLGVYRLRYFWCSWEARVEVYI